MVRVCSFFADGVMLGRLPAPSMLSSLNLNAGLTSVSKSLTSNLMTSSQNTTVVTQSFSSPLLALGGNPSTPQATLSQLSGSTGTVVVAPGIPAIKKWLVDSILAGECIDLAELPPAKGRSKSLTGSLEGQVVLLHATDYFQAKRLIPDLSTWLQCFAIYMAIVIHQHPTRATSLLMYMSTISKLSQKFKWPSWVIYDYTFRQEAAESGKSDWSRVDSSIHAQCFNGMAKSTEGWCRFCHSLDHLLESCPVKPIDPPSAKRKNPNATYPPPKRGAMASNICIKFNRYNGECSFGPSCRYLHICSRCRASHPITQCLKPAERNVKRSD